MLYFKSEMLYFKSEMLYFKSEMLYFKSEMLYFKLEIGHAPLEFREMIEIEHGSDECDEREDDHDTSYYLINNKDAVGIKLAPDLVDEPCETEPPQQRSKHDAQIAHAHLQRHIRHYEGKLGKGGHKEEHDERIGERDEEGGDGIVPERALPLAALMHVLRRIALEAIYAEHQEQKTSENLQIELVLGIIDNVHHETHSQTREECIHDIAESGTDTRHETKPAALVQSALDTQDANRSHRG